MDSKVFKFVAGGGKTEYSKKLLRDNPRGLYLTYNNSVKDEILGMGYLAMTIDAFFTGFIIPKAISKVPLIADGVKILLNEETDYRSGSKKIEIRQDGRLYNGSKVIQELSLDTSFKDFEGMADFTNKSHLKVIFCKNALRLSHPQRDQLVSYIVAVYRDYMIDVISQRFSYIIIDEAQDIKAPKRQFVDMLQNSDIPTIVLGDENQNINGGCEWFGDLVPTDCKEVTYRCGDGICKWIRENLNINITGTSEDASYIEIEYNQRVIEALDDGVRVLLFSGARGKTIKQILACWDGPKRTIQDAKGATIDRDIVIIGESLNKRFMYTAITRTTRNAYSTISKIN